MNELVTLMPQDRHGLETLWQDVLGEDRYPVGFLLVSLWNMVTNGGFTKREQRMLVCYYGIGIRPLSLRQIGTSHRVSPERVRQIVNKTVRRLRHPSRQFFFLPDDTLVAAKKNLVKRLVC